MNSADGTIHFNLSFSQNSIYLRVRLRERFVNPQLLKQLAVYKFKGRIVIYSYFPPRMLSRNSGNVWNELKNLEPFNFIKFAIVFASNNATALNNSLIALWEAVPISAKAFLITGESAFVLFFIFPTSLRTWAKHSSNL